MVTKSELITELSNNNVAVGDENLVSTELNVKTYDIGVFTQRKDGSVHRITQPIYVIDEGLPGESAYYGGGKKIKNYDANDVEKDAKTRYIEAMDSLVAAGTITEYKFLQVIPDYGVEGVLTYPDASTKTVVALEMQEVVDDELVPTLKIIEKATT